MILLDIFEQREPHQQAIDALAQRRIEQLEDYIKELKKAQAQIKDAEQRQAIQDRIGQYEKERVDLSLGRTVHEVEQPQQSPTKGQDLVTPQQRVAGATPPKPGMVSRAVDTAKQLGKWVAGKGGPGQEGPTYEDATLDEQQPTLNKRGQGVKNMKSLQTALDKDFAEVVFQFQGNVQLATNSQGMDLLADYYNGMDSAGRTNFVYNVLGDQPRFSVLCRELGVELTPVPVQQLELPLNEKRSQKKKFKSTLAQREIEKAVAAEPAAGSPIEAFILKSIENDNAQNQQIQALQRELDTVKSTKPGAPDQIRAPSVIPTVQPTASKPAVSPLQVKVGAPQLGKAPVEVPQAKDLPKQDQKILQKVKSIEKRLQTRIDKYQTARALQDTTPQQLAAMQQQINDLQTQKQTATDQLSDKGKQAASGELLSVTRASADILDFSEPLARKQAAVRTDTQVDQPLPDKAVSGSDIPQVLARTVAEHGGGIGPRQHWQSLMRETGRPPMDTLNYYFPDINAQSDVEAIRAAIRQIVDNPDLSKTSKQRLLGQIGMMVQRNRALIGREWRQYLDRFTESQHNEGWSDRGNPTTYSVYIDGREWRAFANNDQARAVAEKVEANLRRQGRDQTVTIAPSRNKHIEEMFAMPGTTVPRKSVIQGYTVYFNPDTKTVSVTRGGDSEEAAIEQARISTVNMKTFRNAAEKLIDRIEDQMISEGIKDTASATAVIACLLTGGTLSGCATAPEQTSTQQVLKTGQDIGRVVQSAKKITRAGAEAEVQQEIRNVMRGVSGRPEELNNSNILRIWKRIKGQPPVPPEPQAPEYGPAEPVKRPATESKEPADQEEYFAIIDRLDKEIDMEQNQAVRQMLMARRAVLQQRAQAAGWIPRKDLREDTAALAAEDAILKRIFVKHRDLMMEYGPDKITQAAESVAYNVGDIAHITDEQINEWVGQVEYILGAKP